MAFDTVDPQLPQELTAFGGGQQVDAFKAVGLGSGHYSNVTARFIAPNANREGYVAFCRIINPTQNKRNLRDRQVRRSVLPWSSRTATRRAATSRRCALTAWGAPLLLLGG